MAGVCEGECMGRSSGDETLTLMRCHSCGVVWIGVNGRGLQGGMHGLLPGG